MADFSSSSRLERTSIIVKYSHTFGMRWIVVEPSTLSIHFNNVSSEKKKKNKMKI